MNNLQNSNVGLFVWNFSSSLIDLGGTFPRFRKKLYANGSWNSGNDVIALRALRESCDKNAAEITRKVSSHVNLSLG